MTDNLQHNDQGAQIKKISCKMIHNLNNMLFIIDAYKDFIKEDQTDSETLANLKQIETALEKSQRILHDWRIEADEIIPETNEIHL